LVFKKKIFFIFFVTVFNLVSAQDQTSLLKGRIKNDSTDEYMSSVHVLNLNSVEGVISDSEGNFEIAVKSKDTLYFSYLGFKPLKVPVSNDMIKLGIPIFRLTQLSFALEEVIVRPYALTGFLDIDVKKVPLNPAGRFTIPGLPQSGYEAGNRNKSSISKAIGSLFNPADFLYNLFGKNPKQMKKLKKMREDDEIKNLLATKFDREILVQLIGVNRVNLDEILRNCNYSNAFIKEANDLQILEAISGCYEEFKILQL
tara:strand:+ start:16985 stop:17755 length:771 start_codon:yes stop_codon:yes gene_type:complete